MGSTVGNMDALLAPFGSAFLQRGAIAALLVAVTCAVVGVWVVLRSLAFLGDALAHGVLPGVALAAIRGFVLAVGAALGAIAGLFFAFQFSFFSPGDFDPLVTFFAYTIVILGGTARNWAVPVGAILFGVLFAGTRFFDFPPFDLLESAERAYVRLILIGLVLIGLMLFRPQGLLGKREEMLLE